MVGRAHGDIGVVRGWLGWPSPAWGTRTDGERGVFVGKKRERGGEIEKKTRRVITKKKENSDNKKIK